MKVNINIDSDNCYVTPKGLGALALFKVKELNKKVLRERNKISVEDLQKETGIICAYAQEARREIPAIQYYRIMSAVGAVNALYFNLQEADANER